MPIETDLPWATLAAIPKSFLTAQQALEILDMEPGQTLVIRGGTSSVGMAALTLAQDRGLTALTTTRNPNKVAALHAAGADEVLIDSGTIAEDIQQLVPGGAQGLLELVGAATLRDSLRAMAPKGMVCYMGGLGAQWQLDQFAPLSDIPSGVRLTAYASRGGISAAACTNALQHIVDGVASSRYRGNVDRVFRFEEIVASHQYIEDGCSVGKIVVTIP